MKKVYVAGKTNNYREVREVQQICRSLGLEITHDWTQVIGEVGEDGGLKGEASDSKRQQWAIDDVQGVRAADLFIMLCSPGVCGTLIEFGIAVELELPIVIIGTPERDSVFFELPNVTRSGYLNFKDCLSDEFGLEPNDEDTVAVEQAVNERPS